MKWEVRKIKNPKTDRKWGIFLMQEYCRTDEPVCYASCYHKESAETRCQRMNEEHGEENA